MSQPPSPTAGPAMHPRPPRPRGRPRDERVHAAILEAARELLIEHGFTRLRLETVAVRAGVAKATIYRRWRSKEALTLDLLLRLAAPHIAVEETGDTRAELRAVTDNALHAITATPFGPVVRAMLSQIAGNPAIGDPFRAAVVDARRAEVARVMARGVARGDLRPDADADLATELLVGPVYFRLVFGGALDEDLAERLVETVMRGYGQPATRRSERRGRPTAADGAGPPAPGTTADEARAASGP